MKQNIRVKQVLRHHLKELGPMTYEEKSVSVVFVILVSLWFFRAPGFMTGWGNLLADKFNSDPSKDITISDSTAAMIIVALLFTLPKEVNIIYLGGSERNIYYNSLYSEFIVICFFSFSHLSLSHSEEGPEPDHVSRLRRFLTGSW